MVEEVEVFGWLFDEAIQEGRILNFWRFLFEVYELAASPIEAKAFLIKLLAESRRVPRRKTILIPFLNVSMSEIALNNNQKYLIPIRTVHLVLPILTHLR